MKAISIRQPWASLIVGFPGQPGPKDVENRRRWHYRHTGLVLIHASKTFDRDAYRALFLPGRCQDWPGTPRMQRYELPTGAVIGLANLVEVARDHPSPWADPYSFHLVLDQRRAFARPVPCKGRLGLFNVPRELVSDQL